MAPPTSPDGRRKCITCGSPFTRSGRAQRYCSVGCRRSEWPEYQKQRSLKRRTTDAGVRGRPPDLARRAQARELRDAGLTLAAIGARMGITRQAVHVLLVRGSAAGGSG